jgi:Reverse transcriptase (RNA-dependent DNA polymerase)
MSAITDLPTAEALLQQEYHAYTQYKRSAHTKCETFLDDLASAIALAELKDKSAILKQLRQREAQRQLSRRLKFLNSSKKAMLLQVEVPDADGDWSMKDKKADIELGCMEENERRFTQASNTPSLLPSSIDLLGWTGDTNFSTQVLQGSANIALAHPSLQPILPYFSTPPATSLASIATTISPEEYFCGWQRAREYTTCGKLGLHFGHFKASCQHNKLLELDRMLTEIPLRTGYSFPRWQTGIDFCIPKKMDSVKVTDLRTILFFEADFNMLNKIVGRRVMFHAERNKTIAAEQYGSRKHRSSIMHAASKQLTFDIVRQTKSDVALLVLDAQSCYNRISIPIASLALLRQGLPQSTVQVMFGTLDHMRHYVRTSFGDSDSFYERCLLRFHGIGQGNGAGPMIWVVVSTPILNKMRGEGYGFPIQHPVSMKILNIPVFAFVDDADFLQHIQNPLRPQEGPQQALTAWNENLIATGGAIVGKKSNAFVILHTWINNSWRMRKASKIQGSLCIDSPSGETETLTILDPHEAVKALGIMFSPSGCMKAQCQYMQGKATEWADRVRTGFIRERDAWYALSTTIMKSLEYPLLATTLTRNQLDSIMRPILRIGLPRSGICQKISRKVAFSSLDFQGLGLVHPYFTQGVRKLLLFTSVNESLPALENVKQTSYELTALQSGL